MNHNDIKTFLSIAANESLSQAANELYITQPALSHRLHRLEQELGTQLILRGKGIRNIELTEAGKQFLPLARRLHELYEETNHIGSPHALTPLRASNVDSLSTTFMSQVYPKFLQAHPTCKLNLSTLRSNAAYQAIETHEIDLALITNPHFFRKIQTLPLFHETMQFVCSPQSQYGDRVSPQELAIENEVYIPWSNPFLLWHEYWFGTAQDNRLSLDNMSLLQSFLRLPDAWAIVPSSYACLMAKKDQVRICKITDGPDPRTCYILYNERLPKPAFMDDLIKTICSTMQNYDDIELVSPPPQILRNDKNFSISL